MQYGDLYINIGPCGFSSQVLSLELDPLRQ